MRRSMPKRLRLLEQETFRDARETDPAQLRASLRR
jgi:hypothetical protein